MKEIPGARHNSLIVDMLAAVRLGRRGDETPWCAAFVNWVLELCDIDGTNSARARSFERWGARLVEPEPGCIVVLKRGKPNSGQGHVGFFLRETANYIWILGGNQRNKVCARRYSKSRLVCYRGLLEA